MPRAAFSVQDGAAQLAADLLDLSNGLRVLDACAAPGGKSAQILEYADVDLLALDSDAQRLPRLAQNLARLGLSADIRRGDAGEPSELVGRARFRPHPAGCAVFRDGHHPASTGHQIASPSDGHAGPDPRPGTHAGCIVAFAQARRALSLCDVFGAGRGKRASRSRHFCGATRKPKRCPCCRPGIAPAAARKTFPPKERWTGFFMRSWKKAISLFCGVTLVACAPAPGAIVVRDASVAGDVLNAHLRWQPAAEVVDALDHGIALDFVVTISAQTHAWLGYLHTRTTQHRHLQLRYFPLSRQYQLRDLDRRPDAQLCGAVVGVGRAGGPAPAVGELGYARCRPVYIEVSLDRERCRVPCACRRFCARRGIFPAGNTRGRPRPHEPHHPPRAAGPRGGRAAGCRVVAGKDCCRRQQSTGCLYPWMLGASALALLALIAIIVAAPLRLRRELANAALPAHD